MADFKQRINELYTVERENNFKMGRNEFSKKCGLTRGMLNGYLIGQGSKFCETLKMIAKNNQTSVSWLVGETDSKLINESELTCGLTEQELQKVKDYIQYLIYHRDKNGSKQAKQTIVAETPAEYR